MKRGRTLNSQPDEFTELPHGMSIARKGRFVTMQSHRTVEQQKAFLASLQEQAQNLPQLINGTVSELRQLLVRMPVKQTLANLAFLVFTGDPETYKEYEHPNPHVMVEYPTWLYTTLPQSSVRRSGNLNQNDFDCLLTLLKRAINQTLQYYMLDPRSRTDQPPSPLDEIRFRTRIHYFMVRGPAYHHHLIEQLAALFNPFESELRQLIGFTYKEAIVLFDMMERLENERFQKLRKKLTNHKDKALLVQISEYMASQMHEIFSFTVDDLADASRFKEDTVDRLLNFFSTTFGQKDIADSWPSVYESIERAPFLKFDDGTWLIHLLTKLPLAIKIGFEEALRRDSKVWNRYENSRSRYLESHAVSLIASTSRHFKKWTGLKYTFDDGSGSKEYELDGLVCIDRTAFLIEGKAGAMSPPARRGGQSALSELKQLVGEAQEQTNRALRYLNSTKEAHFSTATGDVIVRREEFSRVYLISVTLEPLAAFVARLATLCKLGLLKSGELCWSVYDLDLQVISELVEGAGEFVHYVDRRMAIEKLNVMSFDELDWFGFYISEGLFLEEFFKDGQPTGMMVSGYTEPIDEYYKYATGYRKTVAEKPRQPMSLLMRNLIATLERKGPDGFIDAICVLYDCGSKARRDFTKLVKNRRSRKLPFSAFRMHLENCSLICYISSSKISQQLVDNYTKASKYEIRSNNAVGILQSTANQADLHISVHSYPWKADKNLEMLTREFFKSIHSERIR